jgi:paraquat-inducible protein B
MKKSMTEPLDLPEPKPEKLSEPPPSAAPLVAAHAVPAQPRQWSAWAIWLIPITAILVAGGIIIQSMLERGGNISIEFKSAEGLEAGKTKIKYKDVTIGEVKTISLSPDHKKVMVTAQLTKGSGNLMREDTEFWVVRPRIGVGGISGLSTLLAGSHIGVDVGKSDKSRDAFVGLDSPPPIINGVPGKVFALHTAQIGSLDIGAPLYFRHIQAGQVIAYELDKNGRGVSLKIFINAPYDHYVQKNSLFWHASGVDITVDANGFKVQTESVTTVLAGGISFDTPAGVGVPAPANTEFALFANRQKALQRPDTEVRKVRMYFNESVRGLLTGAPVDFRGIVIGEVQAVSLEFDTKQRQYRFPVDINIYPQRLRSEGSPPESSEQLMQRLLGHGLLGNGLRGQLKTGNLLTGMLFVSLDFFPNAPKRAINWKQNPIVLDTMPGVFDELQTSLVSIAKKLDQLPLKDIGEELKQAITSLRSTLVSADKMVQHADSETLPKVNATLEQARKTLAGVETTLAEDGPTLRDARATLLEVQKAAESVRHLAETLERHPESLLRGKPEDKP